MKNLLNESALSRIIEQALFEDVGLGDIATDAIVRDDQLGTAHIVALDETIVAGLEISALVFRYTDMGITLTPLIKEGHRIEKGRPIAHIHGPVKGMLAGERTALNFLIRLSGVAGRTRQFVDLVRNTEVKIIDTRKTMPTLRMLDKYGVKAGGGHNRPYGLDDCVLITSNHLAAAGDTGMAIEAAIAYMHKKRLRRKIYIEVTSFDILREAIPQAGRIDRIILRSFPPTLLERAVNDIGQRTEIEIEGNITEDNIAEIAALGVQYIAMNDLLNPVRSPEFILQLSP